MVYSIINLSRSLYTTQLHVMFVQISSLDIALLRVKKIILPDFYAHHDQIRTVILFRFSLFLSLSILCTPIRLCETHSVTIYGGEAAIDPIVNSLCGFRDRESINYSGGSKLLVEFR